MYRDQVGVATEIGTRHFRLSGGVVDGLKTYRYQLKVDFKYAF